MRGELKRLRDNKRVWCNLRLVGGSFEPVSRLKPNNANFSLQIYAKAWLTLLHQWPYWVRCWLNQKRTSQTEALMLLGPMHHWRGKKGGTDRVWSFCVASVQLRLSVGRITVHVPASIGTHRWVALQIQHNLWLWQPVDMTKKGRLA